MTGRQALLAGAIDYAGLFPPAQLDMATALVNYQRYRESEQAWALGRFVVSVDKLDEAIAALPPDCLAVTGSRNAAENALALAGREVQVIEAPTADAAAVRARLSAHPGALCYCELDPGSEQFGAASEAVQRGGGRAKIRTGGITPAAIPPVEAVLAFLRRCHELDLPCKATAGLHHAVRGEYPLTYAPDAPRAVMHGYANVLLAAVTLRSGGSPARARDILDCDDPASLALGRWPADQIAAGRRFLVGFGSCSFEEPLQCLFTL